MCNQNLTVVFKQRYKKLLTFKVVDYDLNKNITTFTLSFHLTGPSVALALLGTTKENPLDTRNRFHTDQKPIPLPINTKK